MEFVPSPSRRHGSSAAFIPGRIPLPGGRRPVGGLETLDTGVCHMVLFTDPDGNDLMLHNRYAPIGAVGDENATP